VARVVLIVEDEFLIAMDLDLILSRHGWAVIGPAATVAEALRLLQAEQPAVAILDVTLKDGAVSPVAVALRERTCPSSWRAPVTGRSLSGERFWRECTTSASRSTNTGSWRRCERLSRPERRRRERRQECTALMRPRRPGFGQLGGTMTARGSPARRQVPASRAGLKGGKRKLGPKLLNHRFGCKRTLRSPRQPINTR
jgi:hypothetical protein